MYLDKVGMHVAKQLWQMQALYSNKFIDSHHHLTEVQEAVLTNNTRPEKIFKDYLMAKRFDLIIRLKEILHRYMGAATCVPRMDIPSNVSTQ